MRSRRISKKMSAEQTARQGEARRIETNEDAKANIRRRTEENKQHNNEKWEGSGQGKRACAASKDVKNNRISRKKKKDKGRQKETWRLHTERQERRSRARHWGHR